MTQAKTNEYQALALRYLKALDDPANQTHNKRINWAYIAARHHCARLGYLDGQRTAQKALAEALAKDDRKAAGAAKRELTRLAKKIKASEEALDIAKARETEGEAFWREPYPFINI